MSVENMVMLTQFLGGLGLFLFGMHELASGLQKSAGSRMKKLLEVLTKNKLMGVLVGCFVTGIIQSSSATTVMVVGFVNAGLMNLTQSVGVIMGANIGTTVTSWIVASVEWAKFLKPDYFAPVLVAIGAAMVLFLTNVKLKQIGEIVVGFGILFMGMNIMTSALKPLSSSKVFVSMFVELGNNPFLGIIAGMLVTAIIQSSSASVGILQALAVQGLIPINSAVFIIMGQNIGTCITAILSSIGTSKQAKSAAYVHMLFNVIGSIVFSILAVIYFKVINTAIGNDYITATQISMVHMSFNILNTVLLYRFSNFLVIVAQKMAGIKDSQEDGPRLIHLDDRIMQNPSFALQNCEREINRLGNMALENLITSTETIFDKNQAKITSVIKLEASIDSLTDAISQYLVKLSSSGVNQNERDFISSLYHTIHDIERVSDHCENLAELSSFESESRIVMSDTAQNELQEFISMVINCYKNSIQALESYDKGVARLVVDEEQEIDVMEKKLRSSHIRRLAENMCDPVSGVIFLDTLTNLERVADHALNIAEVVLARPD